MKLMVVKIIFEVLLVPNKQVFRIQVNYVISNYGPMCSSLQHVINIGSV